MDDEYVGRGGSEAASPHPLATLDMDKPEDRLRLLREVLPKSDDVRDLMPAANRRHSPLPPKGGNRRA